jgi:hypothetical protein
MSTATMPHNAAENDVVGVQTRTEAVDPRTDEGLRDAVRSVERSGSWETHAGQQLLVEVRRRAVRNAAHVAAATRATMGRGLVDDVLLAAWMVLRRHADKVLAAARPWAYLMSSAQKQVLDEIRAQQLLTNTASIRGRTREVLPSTVRPVGSTATDIATALRHESSGAGASDVRRIVCQIGRHEQPPLVAASGTDARPGGREPWFSAFIDLLIAHGADKAVTVAAVDRLADLFAVTYVGWWEWAARRDPILAHLGLSPDRCGALVALVAGSRRYRHNGKQDSLLAAVRTATEHGHTVELSPDQLRRLGVFLGTIRPSRQPQAPPREIAAAESGR